MLASKDGAEAKKTARSKRGGKKSSPPKETFAAVDRELEEPVAVGPHSEPGTGGSSKADKRTAGSGGGAAGAADFSARSWCRAFECRC